MHVEDLVTHSQRADAKTINASNDLIQQPSQYSGPSGTPIHPLSSMKLV